MCQTTQLARKTLDFFKIFRSFDYFKIFKTHKIFFYTVSDGTVAAAPGKQKELWQLRERIAEALLKVILFGIQSKKDIHFGNFVLTRENHHFSSGWLLLQV